MIDCWACDDELEDCYNITKYIRKLKSNIEEFTRNLFYELEKGIFLGEIDGLMNINDEPPKSVHDFISAIKEVYKN